MDQHIPASALGADRPEAETTLVEKAYGVLRRAIVRVELLPGDKLKIDVLQKQLATAVSQVNTVITTALPALYKQLSDSGISIPNAGEPIKPVP